MAKLNTYVHVADGSGTYRAFGPSDDLPEWAVAAITNPRVWADEPEQVAPVAEPKVTTRGKKV